MGDASAPCRALASVLANADDPAALLPNRLPCPSLDLLVALHQEVMRTMLSDLAHAQRAAAAARAIAQRFADDPLVQAQAHWTQGSAVAYLPDYARALEHYDQALLWYDRAVALLAPATPVVDIRIVQVVRVFCLFELGRYGEALAAVAAAERWLEEHPHDYARLTLLQNRSFLAGSMGDYAQMVELADATIELAERLEYPNRVAQGWINRAYACISLGCFAEASTAIEQGIAAAELAGEPLTVARAHYNRARLLRCQGQLFAALSELRTAQSGLAQATGEAATIALEEAALYEQLCQMPEAQRAARFAASRFAGQAMPTYSAGAALQAARIAIRQQQPSAARTMLNLAKTQARQAQLDVLNAEVALAEAVFAQLPARTPTAQTRAYRAARRAARQAVATLQSRGFVREAAVGRLTLAALEAQLGDPAGLSTYRNLAEQGDRQVQLVATAELGALLPPNEALPYLRRAVALATEQRRALPMEELQARYSSETSPYHMRLVACHLALGEVSAAFESVWAAKAGPLLDLRAAASALDSSATVLLERAKADLARWREQAHDHARIAHHAAQQGQYERAAYHTQRAQAADREVQAQEHALTAALRTLGDRTGQAPIPGLAEVQHALAPGMMLLEYAQCGDDLICFRLARGQPPDYRRLGSYSALPALLDRWSLICRRLMDDQSLDGAHAQIVSVLAPLRDILLGPWRDAIAAVEHVLIAPWGLLHHIPWAALIESGSDGSADLALTLTPCGAMWTPPPYEEAPGRPRLLGYAGSGARRLTNVEGELAAVARYLPDAQVSTAATAADLRRTPPPRLLHMAAHGLTDLAAPLCSTLELADGPFLLLEAHRLDLRGTRLVVLSACETSVRPDYGDMTLALAGAFLCAGAQAVVASLWRVGDAAAAALMERFYAELALGAPLAVALRRAQRQLRETYPLDWAAFQLWAGARGM